MNELQELLDFLKSKGHANVKIPIDLWVSIIEFFAQKSNNLSECERQPVTNNKQLNEFCDCGVIMMDYNLKDGSVCCGHCNRKKQNC